jgi:cardiolipin synthase
MAPVNSKYRHIPNLITGLRIVLVIPILWFILQGDYGGALLLFIIAGLSDGIDGLLAKQLGWTSQLGGILDPVADKLLLMGTIVMLGWQGVLPLWLAGLVVLRDVVIMGGAMAYHYLVESLEAKPLLVSKLNTLVQLVLVLAVLCDKGTIPLPEGLLRMLIYLAGFTTLLSGVAYVWEWGSRAVHKGTSGNVE